MSKKLIPTIGLEVHVELETDSKMFCSCKNDSEEKRVNFNVCSICLGHPGTLPTANKEAVKKTIKAGMGLDCEIQKKSNFDRKNYFYPDLPKGYQISQNEHPLCKNGYLEIDGKKIRIRRIHLEEDTGSLIHPEGEDHSLINFNRGGIPLMELVTDPDIGSGEEAKKFAEELQLILRYLGISQANMEKGQMRVEVNISLAPESELGTKVEIKNLNSFKSVGLAVDYEIERQTGLLNEGEKVIQETRGWNDESKKTVSQREKEEAHDYRYFPDPDLPPLELSDDFINEARSEISELPSQKRERFKKEYGIPQEQIETYVSKKNLSEYFEKVASELREWVSAEKGESLGEEEFKKVLKTASNYLSSDVLGLIKNESKDLFLNFEKSVEVTPENFAEFIKMIYMGEISSKIAKKILKEIVMEGGDPSQIVEEKDLSQITDKEEIGKVVEEVISENSEPVSDYKNGKETAIQYLIGQVMKKSKGRLDPEKVKKELLTKLE